jgi:hypothetical protein
MVTSRLFTRADAIDTNDYTLTSRTAAQLIAAGGFTTGDTFQIIIVNNDATAGDTVVLTVATGITNGGALLTVAGATTATFTYVVTSSTAITVYRTATAALA